MIPKLSRCTHDARSCWVQHRSDPLFRRYDASVPPASEERTHIRGNERLCWQETSTADWANAVTAVAGYGNMTNDNGTAPGKNLASHHFRSHHHVSKANDRQHSDEIRP